jgi:hypothetical protein
VFGVYDIKEIVQNLKMIRNNQYADKRVEIESHLKRGLVMGRKG